MIMTKKSVRPETLQKIRNKSFYLEITDNGNSSVSFFRSVWTLNKARGLESIQLFIFFSDKNISKHYKNVCLCPEWLDKSKI